VGVHFQLWLDERWGDVDNNPRANRHPVGSTYTAVVTGGNLTGVNTVNVTIGAPGWSGLSGIVLFDQNVLDSSLQPVCIEVVRNTCYY